MPIILFILKKNTRWLIINNSKDKILRFYFMTAYDQKSKKLQTKKIIQKSWLKFYCLQAQLRAVANRLDRLNSMSE